MPRQCAKTTVAQSQPILLDFTFVRVSLTPVRSVKSSDSNCLETPKRGTNMILRAWKTWLGGGNPRKGRVRQKMTSQSAERLEMRCLPSIDFVGSTTTLIVVRITANENVTVEYDDSVSPAQIVVTDLDTSDEYRRDAGSMSSLRITCSSSSSSRDNEIYFLINSSQAPALVPLTASGLPRVTLTGNGGDDYIDASQTDLRVSLNGGSGNDTLIGGSFDDWFDGGSGNDILWGGSGDDTMLGGPGNDSMSGGDDQDVVNGQAGEDSLTGGDGNDYVYGGAGRDTVDGGDGIDIVKGQGGFDLIIGSYASAVAERNEFRLLRPNSNSPDNGDTFRGGTTGAANIDDRDRQTGDFDEDEEEVFDTSFIDDLDFEILI